MKLANGAIELDTGNRPRGGPRRAMTGPARAGDAGAGANRGPRTAPGPRAVTLDSSERAASAFPAPGSTCDLPNPAWRAAPARPPARSFAMLFAEGNRPEGCGWRPGGKERACA
ncbi:hypothetical protein P7K49_037062 [Saguinus oedipus]|uniref:Uncharacterized protein n=1 Tax=Saguinus oedipus TaxID=9490 RepID=A0ABQ9TNH2_SAGOE|nr:hypothetical protein P7K49_037062 [Saguinus oedipus]